MKKNKLYLNINIPLFFSIIGIKNNKNIQIYLYENNYYFKILVKTNYIFINKETNNIKIQNNDFMINKKIEKELKKFLISLNSYFFLKIKFKGKGYKINFFKKTKLIKFFFGSSHIQIFKLKNILIKKISKYKFILKNTNLENLNSISKKIIQIRKINPYTLRGIRITKSIIIKRKGRKGSWV